MPVGEVSGSIRPRLRPVAASNRVSGPVDGATQTASPLATTAPGPPATTLPTRTSDVFVSKRGSIRRTDTAAADGSAPTTHRARPAGASPVGSAPTGIVLSTARLEGETRETV